MNQVLEVLSLALAGLLAGAELLVCYGVQPALSSLPDDAHVRARQALVRTLRVLVPLIMLPAIASGLGVAVLGAGAPGAGFRWAGVAAFAGFLLTAFLGTVPINMRVNAWDVNAPPGNWRTEVRLWARLDIVRSTAALLAFACLLLAQSAR